MLFTSFVFAVGIFVGHNMSAVWNYVKSHVFSKLSSK